MDAAVWVDPIKGNIRLTGFSRRARARQPGLSDNEFIVFAMEQLFRGLGLPLDTQYRIAPRAEVDSQDQYFRDFWEDTAFTVNLPNARLFHMEKIRTARNVELAKLDILWMRAVEAGDTSAQSTIATEKQTLRDIPATFSLDGYADPAALKAAWPSELPARE